MGCCTMAAEPWNRLDIPRPAIQCQVTIPLGEDTEQLVNLSESCQAADSVLKSKELNVEVATLDSVLYIYHHRLSAHKPYLALKQVQQCIRRIRTMGLEASIQEMLDLCPNKTELKTESCVPVPSQPIMELVSMKILGACKLLLRLMDCCCKAFHLCLQHLNLEEFIVLNVVLLGLMSRLWVMYRGVLKRLISLYSAQILVQLEVSAFQKMPYFKDFEFPLKIEHYLGPVFNDLVNRKLPKMFSKKGSVQLLNELFKTNDLVTEELKMPSIMEPKEAKGSVIDLGQQVKRLKRDKLDEFDVKALLVSEGDHFQVLNSKEWSSKLKRKPALLSSNQRKCIKHILPKIQEASSFKDMSEHLLYAVRWCRKKKLRREAMFFKYKYLHSNRLQQAEFLGQSLKKKLQSWKKSMCHCLRERTLKADHLKTYLRIQRCHQSWKWKVTYSRKRKLHKCHVAHSESQVKRTDLKSLCSELFSGDQEVSPVSKDTALRSQTSEPSVSSASMKNAKRRLSETDDIDDIFSSIGI
ncbi:nucleolus and neural progenitor protein [Rana temporaria]|uniref:nucleolus and neural progenitor protein n=1 Tax=Rana temporaria TaxID=8407 RepID=UPI001AAD4FD2|nr:nucleolus and neural progenitor protein [Rana temporaria]